MELGRYVDGRSLSYDETKSAFTIEGTPVGLEQIRGWDGAGQIEWASDQIAAWFRTSFPAPAQPGVTLDAAVARKPWFKKWWVYAIAAVVILGALSQGSSNDPRPDEVSDEPGYSEKQKAAQEVAETQPTTSLSVTGPEQTEADAVELMGRTEPGAALTMNGQAITVGPDGSFLAPVSLVAGDNVFVFKAEKTGSKPQEQRVTVKRVSYVALSARDFEILAKNPDAHTGEYYIIYGEVTQFDAATGADVFRANIGATKSGIRYGMTDYSENSMLTGDSAMLANVVEGDCFEARVQCGGSYSYETQIGGNTTVPLFRVTSISVYASTK